VIVTQLFYDVELFLKFVDDCRDIGITVPIVPGIMPIQTYAGFARMVGFCKTYVPPEITAVLEGIKDNEEACRAYGIQLGVDMCRRMLAAGTPGVHLYSLNQDKAAIGILTGLGLINTAVLPRALPWRRPVSAKGSRAAEGVRPLHWAARPRSYLQRTAAWAAPPGARWAAEADGAAVGSRAIAPLVEYNTLARPHSAKGVAARREALASRPLTRAGDVAVAFHAYLAGASTAFPWSETGAPPPETAAAAARLAALVDAGLLVLYGCGSLHGAPSGAAATPGGWGAPGGRLFQKAYVEGFAPAAALPALQAAVAALPGGGAFLSARPDASAPGGFALSGSLRQPAAAAWLLAPAAELVQPTVLAPDAFAAWAPEAYAAWRADWAVLFEGDAPEVATSRATLAAVADSHVLFAAMAEDTEKGDALFAALTAAAKAK
jgi:methylenetetrahydrofolate reductase (NADPH)